MLNENSSNEFRLVRHLPIDKSGLHFDDITLCNSQGVYKNGITKLQEQLNTLQQIKDERAVANSGIQLYPNPASDKIEILYALEPNENATLLFYDMLGNIVKKMSIQNDKIKQTIQTSDMSNGLYTYKFVTSLGKNFVGKFIIDK